MLRKFLLFSLLAVTVTSLNLPGVPIEFTEKEKKLSATSDTMAKKISQGYIKYIRTGNESETLKKFSRQLAKPQSKKSIFSTNIEELGDDEQFFLCTACRALIYFFAETFKKKNETISKKIVLELCNRFKIQTPEVCSGFVDLNIPILHYIMMNSAADARTWCASLPINFCKVEQRNFEWNVYVNICKKILTEPKSDVPKKTGNDLTVVHLTDIHFDPEYKPGSLAECREPLCCRHTPASDISNNSMAGYWSDYRRCDSPLHMVENALDHVKESNKKIDYIYQTGDIVPHNIWSTTKEKNKAILTQIHDLIAEKFVGIPVYPSVGNHESHPTNVFRHEDVPPEMNVNWLYEHLWSNWQRWLPAEAKTTVLKGGYYTVSPRPGFRVISLNNNDCYVLNWWIYFDGSVTSQSQLDWLQKTLLAAEKAGEYVHILAHIPSGDAVCWTVWARQYNRIIERYSHIIGGIFGGHTHKDELNLHYSQNGQAMAITWIAGSLTSFSFKNPNYRTYEVEPATYQVVDHHTWIFNLTEANEHGNKRSPQWVKEYQFTEFTNDLSPAGIDALIERMAEEPSLLRQYWKYKMTSSDPKLAAGCNESCLSSTLCSLVKTFNDDKARCKVLTAKLKESLANEDTT